MLARLHDQEPGGAYLARADVATVLDALEDAAEEKHAQAARCNECDGAPEGSADICATCEWRLRLADSYDALAARIGDARQPGQAHVAWLAHKEIAAAYQQPPEPPEPERGQS